MSLGEMTTIEDVVFLMVSCIPAIVSSDRARLGYFDGREHFKKITTQIIFFNMTFGRINAHDSSFSSILSLSLSLSLSCSLSFLSLSLSAISLSLSFLSLSAISFSLPFSLPFSLSSLYLSF